MFSLYSPFEDIIHHIQKKENAYYWSRCVAGFLRKHGIIAVQRGFLGEIPDAFVLATRLLPFSKEVVNSPGFFEGPLDENYLQYFGVKAKQYSCEIAEILDGNGNIVGTLATPDFTVRKIPLDRREVSSPYPFISKDPYWNSKKIYFQELVADQTWSPVAYVKIDGTSDKRLIAVSDGRKIICGFPVFDVIGRLHAFAPLDVGYYAHTQHSRSFHVEEWLVKQLIFHSHINNYQVLQVGRWPLGFQSAFTIRHDYDRLITDDDIDSILSYYQQKKIKSSWGFLCDKCNTLHSKKISARGHEVALHSVASSPEEFHEEIEIIFEKTGIQTSGYTSHGGIGAPGFLGETQYVWAENEGLLCGEILGRGNNLPHPVNKVTYGIPAVGRMIVPASHYSFDSGTKPEAHKLEYMMQNLPARLNSGCHVVLMNHPDIHIEELVTLLQTLDFSKVWLATFEEISKWSTIAKFRSCTRKIGADLLINFTEPLPIDTSIKLISRDGKETEIICEAGVDAKVIKEIFNA